MVRWLDLYCGQGGVAAGIEQAGSHVVYGVDLSPQPRYPYRFLQSDALDHLEMLLAYNAFGTFDAIWASPPCQLYSKAHGFRGADHRAKNPDLISYTRDLLRVTGLPYVIENVPGAPLDDPVTVCGTGLGLRHDGFELRRERLFESNVPLVGLACVHERPPRLCSAITPPATFTSGTDAATAPQTSAN